MLHVTNGDCAAERLRAADLPGDVLPWRDVLHEGPIPANLDADALRPVRAAWLAAQGWTTEAKALSDLEARDAGLAEETEEVVLWFEPDLYDQLQLLQAVAQRPEGVPVSFVLTVPNLGAADPAWLAWLLPHRPTAGAAFFDLCARAWDAVRAPDPVGVEALLPELNPLPTLQGALRRLLEELPDMRTGLSRTERQILDVFGDRPRAGLEAFQAQQQAEAHTFLGDAVFHRALVRLGSGTSPLVETESGASVPADAMWPHTVFRLTGAGRAVRGGEQDWMALATPERWVGGVRVDGSWRWDADAGRIVQP